MLSFSASRLGCVVYHQLKQVHVVFMSSNVTVVNVAI
jgi:hypothetical protein